MLNKISGKYSIYIFASLASIILMLIRLYYNQPFDQDGILYLNAASAFLSGGLHSARIVYSLPLYPILIALISKTSHLSLLSSGYLLNTILDTLTIIIFIALIKEMGGSRRTQIIGALIILFFPFFAHFRTHILRGHGYFAFATMSLLFLMLYLRTYQWRYVFGWTFAILIATLFRIEGSCLAILTPLVVLINPEKKFFQNICYTTKIYSLYILGFLISLIYALKPKSNEIVKTHYHLISLQRIINEAALGLHKSWFNLQQKAKLIEKYIISAADQHFHGLAFLSAGLLTDYIGILIYTLGLLYFALAIYAIYQQVIPKKFSTFAPWITFILLNIFLTLLFITQNFFISHRYVALLSLLLLLAVPFALERIYLNWQQKINSITGSRWLFPLISIWLIYIVITATGHFGASKTYLVDAGKWIGANTPTDIVLCSNDKQSSYYANRKKTIVFTDYIDHNNTNDSDDNLFLNNINILKNCDYVTAQVGKNDSKTGAFLNNTLHTSPIKLFNNKRGDKLLIYRSKMS